MADEVALRVPEELDGERVDKALASLLDLSRAAARELVESGVTVDGSSVRPSDRVRAGSNLVSPSPAEPETLAAEHVDFDVLHEDADVVVVDKPPGLVVHPGSGRRKGTLAAGLMHRYPELSGVGERDRWGLVHRLDKETSGALLVARNHPAYRNLTEQLRSRAIGREYITLVDGFFDAPTGTIEAPIGRDPTRPTRRAVVATGKHARTHFEVMEVFSGSNSSLLRVTLDTGRTHQIRVHLSSIDRPVIGDRLYSRRPTTASSPRVFLHAATLRFTHPGTGFDMTVDAPLRRDLQEVLRGLRESDGD